jgi:hypothetical protein
VTRATLELTAFWINNYNARPSCTISFNASIYRALQPVASLSAVTWDTAPSYNASAPLFTFTLPPSANMSIASGRTASFSLTSQALVDDVSAWTSNASAWVMASDVDTEGCFFELLTTGATRSTLTVETALGEPPINTCAPTAAPTTAAPTLAPTAGPTTAAPTHAPTAVPSAAPSAAPTHVPTMQAATITVPANDTLTVSPPGSPLVMSMRASADTELTVRTLTEPEKVVTYVTCPALSNTMSLAAYEIDSGLPPGNVSINLTLGLEDRPYGTPDRNVYLCLNGSWVRTLDVCRSLNVSNAVSGTFDADMRTLVATLCHFSTYMVAEYDSATRTCVSGRYGCLCDDSVQMATFGPAVIVGAILLATARLVLSIRLHFVDIAACIILAITLPVGTARDGYNYDPDSPVNKETMRIISATTFSVAAALKLAVQCVSGFDETRASALGDMLSVLLILAGLGVSSIGVSGKIGLGVSLSIVGGLVTVIEALYTHSRLPPRGRQDPADEKNPRADTRIRRFLCLVCAACVAVLGWYTAQLPCDTTYKGPV